ncbi:hypothetical protein [Streptomyces sp. NPDC003719]
MRRPGPPAGDRAAGQCRGRIAGLAARGLGVAVLSASTAAAHRDRLTARTLEDVHAPGVLALIRASAPGPAVRELLTHCRSAFGGPRDALQGPAGE